MKGRLRCLGWGLAALVSVSATAKPEVKDKAPLASAAMNGTYIDFQAKQLLSNATIAIAGPNGFNLTVKGENRVPDINLLDYGELPDGEYNYEISATVGPKRLVKDTMNNGRGDNDFVYVGTAVYQYGHFRVVDGQIKVYRQYPEPSVIER